MTVSDVPNTNSKRRKRDARFIEIAAEAGVSLSTVNRVLNELGSVSESARARVIEAARRLAVKRVLPEVHHGLTHIDIVLSLADTPLLKRISSALIRIIQMLDRNTQIHRIIVPDDESKVLAAIQQQKHKRKGLIVMARNTPKITSALEAVIQSGTKVVTMVSDIDLIGRLSYSGIDNYQAGSTAAWFIRKMVREQGCVLKLVANDYLRAHCDRSKGFSDALAGSGLIEIEVETQDKDIGCYQAVSKALSEHNILAIYNSGYGSDGVMRALHEHDAVGRVVWVAHEMYDHHNEYLRTGAISLILDQDPDTQVMAAVQQVLHACGVIESGPQAGPVEFRVFCQANRRETRYNE